MMMMTPGRLQMGGQPMSTFANTLGNHRLSAMATRIKLCEPLGEGQSPLSYRDDRNAFILHPHYHRLAELQARGLGDQRRNPHRKTVAPALDSEVC